MATIQARDDASYSGGGWGSWTEPASLGAWNNLIKYGTTTPSDTNIATFTFTGLSSGLYEVAVNWAYNINRSTAARFEVLDGTTSYASTTKNQTVATAGDRTAVDSNSNSRNFELAFINVPITSGTLVLKIKSGTGESGLNIIASGVRIDRTGDNGAAKPVLFYSHYRSQGW
jgi:hypothetical protein